MGSQAGSLALLRGLLEHFSPTGQEEAAAAYLVGWMQAAGLTSFIDEVGNAVGIKGEGPNQIVLLGHIDTAPGEIAVQQEGDVLWGRGAVDAKGPMACFAAATAPTVIAPGWQMVVIGAVGEEGDSRGAKFALSQYRPRMTVIGEPSGWDRITLGYKGSVWAEFRITQPMAHPAAGVETACEKSVAFWSRVTAWAGVQNHDQPRVFDQVSPSLRSMGSRSDGFSQTAQLSLNMRIPPHLTPDFFQNNLHELAGDGELVILDSIPAYRAEKNTPLVRALLAAIRRHGGKPVFNVKSGTSDMNLVGPVWSCPMLAYGPGDSELDHTPNEHIAIPEYLAGIEILTDTLEALTSTAAGDSLLEG